jgi:excisionase family DNA binding protein
VINPYPEYVWFSYSEAAKYLNLAEATLKCYVSAKQIPVYGRPHYRRFRRDMLDEWLIDADRTLRKWKIEISRGH